MLLRRRLALILFAFVMTGTMVIAGFRPPHIAVSGRSNEGAQAPTFTYRIVHAYPHDVQAFTQGIIYRNGVFYESTGLNGHSSLRKVEMATGKVLLRQDVDQQYFAEGLTDWNDRLIQLTWQSKMAFSYDITTFNVQRTFRYSGEGWGLTHDQKQLIMSDGTSSLRFLDPLTFQETGRVVVKDGGGPVEELNELEMVKGEIFANVWQTDRIARISPRTGEVTGWIDLKGLLPAADRASADVLNGIAYDAAGDRLFVTGKLWPRVFEIKLVAR